MIQQQLYAKMIKARPCITEDIDLDEDFMKLAMKRGTKESKLARNLSSKLYLLLRFPYKFSGMSQLQKMKLNFTDFGIVTKKVAIGLADRIRNLHRLKKLKMTDLDCSRWNDPVMSFFTEGISKLISLEKLHINFKNLDKIGSYGFDGLLSMLARLQKLKKIHLSISALTLKGDVMPEIGRVLARLKSLESVHLSLTGCRNIDDETVLQLMKNIEKAKGLKRLCLDILRNNRTTAVGCSHLIQKIPGFPKLTKLNLSFNKDFSQKELFELSNEISKMNSLSNLKLDPRESKKIEGSEMSLLKSIIALKGIKKLKLSLFWGNNTIVLHLSNMLAKMTQLTQLQLFFKGSSQINDNGFANLNKALYKLTELKSLDICLDGCDQITDTALGQFSVVISKLTGLKYLNVGLSWSNFISELGLKQFSIAISRLPNLLRVFLNFKGSKNLSGESLLKLSNSLSKLKSLKDVDLDFSWCPLLTKEVTEKFKSEIMKMKLDDPKIDFTCSSSSSS